MNKTSNPFKIEHIDINKAKMLCSDKEISTLELRLWKSDIDGVGLKRFTDMSGLSGDSWLIKEDAKIFNTGVSIIGKDTGSPQVVFGEQLIKGLCHSKIGFIGLDEVDCIVLEAIIHGETIELKNKKEKYLGDKCFIYVIHKTDGVIAKKQVTLPEYRNSKYKSRTRELIDSLLVDELNDTENVKYDMIEKRVYTKHFEGVFEILNDNYMHVRFIMRQLCDNNDELDDSVYSLLVSLNTGKVVNNKVYTGIKRITNTLMGLFDTCVLCEYTVYMPRCRDKRFVNDLINLETGETLMSGTDLAILDGFYIKSVANSGLRTETTGIYAWDKKSDKLIEVIKPHSKKEIIRTYRGNDSICFMHRSVVNGERKVLRLKLKDICRSDYESLDELLEEPHQIESEMI